MLLGTRENSLQQDYLFAVMEMFSVLSSVIAIELLSMQNVAIKN